MKVDKLQRKACIVFSLIGILFSFFCITGYELAKSGNIIWTKAWTGKCLLLSLVLGVLSGIVFTFLFFRKKEHKSEVKTEKFQLPCAGKCFFISWGLLLLAWLPAYLAYYPGICAYDFTIQFEQITMQAYNEHHPLLHTLMIEWFYEFGAGIGNPTLGIALFTLCQMLVLSASFAVGIAACRYLKARNIWVILLTVYGMFMPFHWFMAVSITKDTYFTAFMLVQIVSLCVILVEEKGQIKPGLWDILLFFSSLGMILFRSNGRYALFVAVVLTFLAVIFGKKRRKLYVKVLVHFIGSIVIGSILLSVLLNATGAVQGDRREMLSMPIQQLSRTMVYHGGAGVLPEDDNTMSEEDRILINDFILDEAYKEYRPDISDPVKKHTNTYVFVYRMKDFMKTYFHLFTQYPGDYINAALAINAGYLYPMDTSHAYINVNNRDKGLGYVQTRWLDFELSPLGIGQDSKWPWLYERLEEFADSNGHLQIPVLKYLFVPGSYLWICLFFAAWLYIHKKYKELISFSIILGYYITLFLGPTVQLRYIYPIMVIVPYMAVYLLRDKTKSGMEQ